MRSFNQSAVLAAVALSAAICASTVAAQDVPTARNDAIEQDRPDEFVSVA